MRKMKSAIFLPRNLDDPNRFGMAGEIRFCAQRVFAVFWASVERAIFSVIPGRAKHEPGIHFAATLADQWIPGSRQKARPGMTEGAEQRGFV